MRMYANLVRVRYARESGLDHVICMFRPIYLAATRKSSGVVPPAAIVPAAKKNIKSR